MIHEKAKAMTKKEVSGYRTSKLPWGEAGCLEASSMVMMMLASLKLCYMLSKCACIRHLRPARERLPLFTNCRERLSEKPHERANLLTIRRLIAT